jgi:hypothetical protein
MGKRGPKPKGKVKIEWSPNFAYAIGLLTTDGCLSMDGRHIDLTSVDYEQLRNFLYALHIDVPISEKHSGQGKIGRRVQFSDVQFYDFLTTLGLTPKKSKTLGRVAIPSEFFFDFLRGCFDGDGCFYSYWDPRWKSSFMFYTTFVSASKSHIDWLRSENASRIQVKGHISRDGKKSTYQLKYAKAESLKILKNMYYSDSVLCLSRKKKKIDAGLKEASIDKRCPGGEIGRHATLRW